MRQYSIYAVSKAIDVEASQLRYWMQSGIVTPTSRKRGNPAYSEFDILRAKSAKELLDAGVDVSFVRTSLQGLLASVPKNDDDIDMDALSKVRVYSEGQALHVACEQELDNSVHNETNNKNDEEQPIDSFCTVNFLAKDLFLRLEGHPSYSQCTGTDNDAILPAKSKKQPPLVDTTASTVSSIPTMFVKDNVQQQPISKASKKSDSKWIAHTSRKVGKGCAKRNNKEEVSTPKLDHVIIEFDLSDTNTPAISVAKKSTNAFESFLEGMESLEVGDSAKALVCFGKALRKDPSLTAAYTNLGALLYSTGDAAGAKTAFMDALSRDPEQKEARLNLALVYEDEGEIEKACMELRVCVSMHPEYADALYNYALVLVRVGGHAQAADCLSRYMETEKDKRWLDRAKQLHVAISSKL